MRGATAYVYHHAFCFEDTKGSLFELRWPVTRANQVDALISWASRKGEKGSEQKPWRASYGEPWDVWFWKWLKKNLEGFKSELSETKRPAYKTAIAR